MFTTKFEGMKKQQLNYLKTETEYHYLIEALLFKEQKQCFGSIEYVTNGFGSIEINVLRSKNIKQISLPIYDSTMFVWKSMSFSIDYIKKYPRHLIDKYTIEISEVDKLESSRNEQFDELNEEFLKLKQEYEKLKQENEKLLRLRKEDEELTKLKNENLAKLKNENLRLKQENANLIQQCFARYKIDNLIIKDDNIIRETPFRFNLTGQSYIEFTLSELIRSNYVIRKQRIELVVSSITIENKNIKFVKNEFIYQYNYSKAYANCDAIFPADGRTKFTLVNNGKYLVYEKSSYVVCIYVTLN